ncbi:MAG: LVIVD repeat-containing protein [Actinomycetota bacterium]
MRRALSIPVALLVAAACVQAQASALTRFAHADKSINVSVVARFPYKGGDGFWAGSDLDFSGRFAYGGHLGGGGGVHIYDVRGEPREVGFIACPGTQNDVAVVRPGLLALGFHTSRCARKKAGIQLIDVRNPRRPKLLGAVGIPGGTHTLTVYPGRALIYSSPGGEGDPETIIDARDPRNPKVVGRFDPGPTVGCHDVAFHFEGDNKLGFCAGENATQVWDVSKPATPKVLSQITNPLIYFHHSVAATSDGNYLVVGDEALGTAGGICNMSANHPTGAVWVYDISDPQTPALVSFYGLQREDPALLCTAHNYNFIPGTRYLVAGWYLGGMNVLDLSDPANPVEVAHFRTDDSDYWSAYWYDGRIYASGGAGLDVLEVRGLR